MTPASRAGNLREDGETSPEVAEPHHPTSPSPVKMKTSYMREMPKMPPRTANGPQFFSFILQTIAGLEKNHDEHLITRPVAGNRSYGGSSYFHPPGSRKKEKCDAGRGKNSS